MINKIKSTLAILSIAASPVFADYPEKDIQGIIQWGAGGSTDTVMRSIAPHVEDELGTDIVMINRTGGVGAIATKYVYAQKADGYTLLMGAENPQMYKVLGLGEIDYGDMVPISILARGTPIFVAQNDAPYNNMREFVEYVQQNPGEVRTGMTGNGGLTSIVLAMLDSQVKLDLTRVPYNGDGPALTALQSGTIDVMSTVLGAAIDHVRAGRMKVIGLMDNSENALVPGVEPITEDFPGLSNYLPWGPFFGVFVKQGTPEEAVIKLQDAFRKAATNEDFVNIMTNRGYTMMNLSGDEASSFLDKYKSVSSWLVYDAGYAKHSPADFDIPRPESN
ncbi:MAG: tripartite tricarboxylate transporter substrate binding protein [Oceanospirillaceae bacterium]|nr:tripartite tricarboxylate transporter substrate binding protein [Oceanospirillaceae bacterium]